MKKDITIYLIARLNSERLPNKMIIPFDEINNHSLFERACIKMKDLKFKNKVAIGEKELIKIANKYNIEIEKRPQNELDSNGKLREVFNFLSNTKTSHAMLVSPCNPFITADVLNNACNVFLKNNYISMTSVIKDQNWYFNYDYKPISPIDPYKMNSKDIKLYKKANVFEIFPVKRFLEKGIYYTFENKNDPFFYEIEKKYSIDVDDETDFNIAKSLLGNY